jgi:pyridoxamine 5'-phosphate oxidase
MALNLHDLRREYASHTLDVSDVDQDPIIQFKLWFQEALDSEVLEPNALVLSTITADHQPNSRVVLLKGFDEQGFVFFTNYNSQKGQELAQHPFACMVFSWLELHRQVKIQGEVEKLSPEESTAYFQSRPRGSQIGAWASSQSSVVDSREVIEENVKALEAKYAGQEILPRPAHWGGFLLKPKLMEFWQGRPSRLHDRIQFTKEEGKTWKIERLSP